MGRSEVLRAGSGWVRVERIGGRQGEGQSEEAGLRDRVRGNWAEEGCRCRVEGRKKGQGEGKGVGSRFEGQVIGGWVNVKGQG